MFKLVSRLIKSNLIRSMLIVISIAACVALFYSGQIIMDSILVNFENNSKSIFGDIDVVITDESITEDDMPFIEQFFPYDENSFIYRNKHKVNTRLENFDIYLTGIDFERESAFFNYNFIYPNHIKDNESFYESGGVIISQSGLGKLHLKKDDIITINTINGAIELPVINVIEDIPQGEYLYNGIQVFISNQYLIEIFDLQYSANTVLIDSTYAPDKIDDLISEYYSLYGKYTYSFNILRQHQINMIDHAMLIMSVFKFVILFLGVFIIVVTYRVLLNSRMKSGGLLRSMGMSRRRLILLLVSEGLFLGLTASLIGIIFGALVSDIITRIVFIGYKLSTGINIIYWNIKAIIISITIGLSLPVLSSVIPIYLFSKQKIVRMIKYNDHVSKDSSYDLLKFAIGIIFFIIEIILIFTTPDLFFVYNITILFFMLLINIVALYLVMPLTILAVGQIINYFCKYEKLKQYELSLKLFFNNNRKIISSVFITVLSLISTLTVSSLVDGFNYSIEKNIADMFKYDYVITNTVEVNGFSQFQRDKIEEISELADYSLTFFGKKLSSIIDVQYLAVHPSYFDIFDFELAAGNMEEIRSLLHTFETVEYEEYTDKIYYCLVTEDYAERANISLYATLPSPVAHFMTRVCGILKNDMAFSNLVIMDYDILKSEFITDLEYNTLFVKNKNIDNALVSQTIDELFNEGQYNIITNQSLNESMQYLSYNNSVLLKILNVIVFFITVLGLLNIYHLKTAQRKNEISLIRCIGGNKNKIHRLIFFEFWICMLASIIISLPFSILFIKIISISVQKLMPRITIYLFLSWRDFLLHALIIGLITYVFAKIALAKLLNSNIISNITKGE